MSDKIEASEPVAITNPTKEEVMDDTEGDVKPAAAEEDVKVKAEEDVKVKKESPDAKKRGPRTYENGVLKTSRMVSEHKHENLKYDASILEESSDPVLIRGQVEFYFGDANLPNDNFLWNEVDGATNKPIPIKKIREFNRMRRFKDFDVIVKALKESKFLDVVEEDGETCVQRKIPYDPNTPRSRADKRSVYVKGFGDEVPSSQFDIETFFLAYGSTNQVRLRRTEEKLFKGSVFVEWVDEETQQAFLSQDPAPKWKGNPLKIMSKKAYMEEKEKEIKDGKLEPKESWGPYEYRNDRGGGRGRGFRNSRGGRDGDRGRGGDRGHRNRDRSGDRGNRGDRDPNDWKKRREEDQANGFKNDRRHKDHRDKKGGRDHHRSSNGRNRDREDKRDRDDKASDKKPNDDKPDTEVKTEVKDTPSPVNEKKRAREDDGNSEEQPAKKVDSKDVVSET